MITVAAQPFDFAFELHHAALVIIDMQRDFIEPGGFGESLGNNVALLEAIVPAAQAVLGAWRTAGGLVVHTREAHRSDLSVDQDQGEEDRHGVVAAGLDLQGGLDPLLELQAPGAQQGKDRGGVGGADDGGEE